MDIKLFDLTNEAYVMYKTSTKGNQDITYEMAKAKLTRNILLANELPVSLIKKLRGYKYYQYGNLYILVKRKLIVNVKNTKGGVSKDWKLDKKKYIELNRKLGIKNGKFK